MNKIQEIIVSKKLKPKDAEYHTLRTDENGSKIRALVVKGEPDMHVEYVCGKCGHEAYVKEEYKKVSKAAKIRWKTKCEKCGLAIKIEKLKGKKK